MGARMSRYRSALLRHEQRLQSVGRLYADDVLSGDLVLICEKIPTGLQSNALTGYTSHAHMNPSILKGIKRSQLGKPAHLSQKDVSGFNRCGIVVCDRLGDKFVLEANAAGIVSTRLQECITSVQDNDGVVAIRQVDCPDGRKFGRALLRIFESTKDGPFSWENAAKWEAAAAANEKAEVENETAAKLCATVLRIIKQSKSVLSIETKAELDQMFSLYDRNGDGTIDEEELETMIDEIGGKSLSTEDRLQILTKLDVDNDGGISLSEFYKAMQQLPGISSMNNRNVSTLLSAQFTLQLYISIGLLKGLPEGMYVEADMLRFDAEQDFEWVGADFYPEVRLIIRGPHEPTGTSSRLSKIPKSAVRRRDKRRKARARKRKKEDDAKNALREQDAQRKQLLAERDEQIRHQIEQARILKEKEREYQNQLRQEEEKQRRTKDDSRLKASREKRQNKANAEADKAAAQGSDDSLFGDLDYKLEGDIDEQNLEDHAEGKEHDRTLWNKDFTSILVQAALVDMTSVQYYYVDFDAIHTGLTVQQTSKEDAKVWVVVDVRPGSQADAEGVEAGHLIVSVGDTELEDAVMSTPDVNRLLRTGSRPFSVSLAEPNGAGKAPLEKTKSGRALADGEFEVIFQQSELGFDVELVDDGGEPYIAVVDVEKGSEAYDADVLEDYAIISVRGTKITGKNCTTAEVKKLLAGKRPVNVVFGS